MVHVIDRIKDRYYRSEQAGIWQAGSHGMAFRDPLRYGANSMLSNSAAIAT